MSNADQAQEPSMEEILASIRRIISEDDDNAPEAAADSDLVPDEDVADGGAEEVAEAIAGASAGDEEAPESELDADMTFDSADDMAADDSFDTDSEEEMAAFDEDMEPASEDDGDEVLELTEEVSVDEASAVLQENEDEDDIDLDSMDLDDMEEPESSADPEDLDPTAMMVDGEEEIVFSGESDIPEIEQEAEPEMVSEPVVAAVAEENLLSNVAGDSVASSFGTLENLVLSTQSRTIEDLLQAMLKPMLRDWLDANLPTLVERMVRDEIERVSRGRR